MVRQGSLIVVGLVLLLAAPAFAQKSTPATRAADDQRALLNQMAEAQKWAGEQLWHVKEGIDAVPGMINELKDANAARDEEVQKTRDEVKGLYVESSGVKQQIDSLKDDIGGVNSNVSGFRTYSGFFIAVMILLLAVIFIMTIRR